MTLASISGKEAVRTILRQRGVTAAFANPGSTELPLLMDALVRGPGMRYVRGLQEGAVVAMADGYALGRPPGRSERTRLARPRQRHGYSVQRLKIADSPARNGRTALTSGVAGALARGFASGGPYLIDVQIDPVFT